MASSLYSRRRYTYALAAMQVPTNYLETLGDESLNLPALPALMNDAPIDVQPPPPPPPLPPLPPSPPPSPPPQPSPPPLYVAPVPTVEARDIGGKGKEKDEGTIDVAPVPPVEARDIGGKGKEKDEGTIDVESVPSVEARDIGGKGKEKVDGTIDKMEGKKVAYADTEIVPYVTKGTDGASSSSSVNNVEDTCSADEGKDKDEDIKGKGKIEGSEDKDEDIKGKGKIEGSEDKDEDIKGKGKIEGSEEEDDDSDSEVEDDGEVDEELDNAIWASYGKNSPAHRFPPPMPLLARTGNLSSRMPWVLNRTYKEDGSLVIREVPVKHHEYFRARRANGRLTLQLMHMDESAPIDVSAPEPQKDDKEASSSSSSSSSSLESLSKEEIGIEEGVKNPYTANTEPNQVIEGEGPSSVTIPRSPGMMLPSSVPEPTFLAINPGCFTDEKSGSKMQVNMMRVVET